MAHAYNPSYLRGGNQKDWFEASLGKKEVSETSSQQNKPGMMLHSVVLDTARHRWSKASPRKNMRPCQ
jgi:hypothetical protein